MNKQNILAQLQISPNLIETCMNLALQFKLYEPAWESVPRISPRDDDFIQEEEECLENIWLAYIIIDGDEVEFFVEEGMTLTYYCEATYEALKEKILQNRI